MERKGGFMLGNALVEQRKGTSTVLWSHISSHKITKYFEIGYGYVLNNEYTYSVKYLSPTANSKITLLGYLHLIEF